MTDGPDYIIEALWDLTVPIDFLRPDPTNPRKGDVKAVARSLAAFKQRKPVVAKSDGTITAGHHMHAAAVGLGWERIAAVLVDDDDETARAFGLADNRTNDLGRYDHQMLADSLALVVEADDGLLEATSYSVEDLETLLAHLDSAGPKPKDGDGDDGGGPAPKDDGAGITCPSCGATF